MRKMTADAAHRVSWIVLVGALGLAASAFATTTATPTTTTTTAVPTTTTTTAATTTTLVPGADRVTLCHKGKLTVRVGPAAVPAHLAHGDTLGACD